MLNELLLLSRVANPSHGLPAPRTREQALSVKMTFQGLEVETSRGLLPWFDAALFSPDLTPRDRQNIYQEKRRAGDTHAILGFGFWDGPLYWSTDEQPYKYMRAPAFQRAENHERFLDAIRECLSEGFTPLCFLEGDDGENGYPIARAALAPLVDLLGSAERDFNLEIPILPGWDGVFYGYTPEHIAELGRYFRTLSPRGLLGIEHQPGRIPFGGGSGDWFPGGGMQTYDLLLHEFDYPVAEGLSHDRTIWHEDHKIWTSPYEEAMGMIWQVGGRILGPDYKRPYDQPSDNDVAPPWYWKYENPRGKFFACAFEWVGEYYWVRGKQDQATQTRCRNYLKGCGWKWTG